MSFFNRLFKKTEEISTDKLQSRIIYNSQANFIILISYGAKDFYSVIEFTSALSELHDSVNVITSHTATEEEAIENENSFSKKAIKIINNRYYLLIGGSSEQYAKLFDTVPQSNTVLKCIIQDIYHNRDSAPFSSLIELGILDLNRFKYQNIVPNIYDRLKEYSDYADNVFHGWYDDFREIMSKLPSSFSAIDVARLIYIYAALPNTADLLTMRLPEFISDTLGEKNGSVDMHYNVAIRDFFFNTYSILFHLCFFDSIIPYADLDILSVITVPVYMREELNEEDRINGDIPLDKMDELFQQDYDRFTQPTAEYTDGYEDIDEIATIYDAIGDE